MSRIAILICLTVMGGLARADDEQGTVKVRERSVLDHVGELTKQLTKPTKTGRDDFAPYRALGAPQKRIYYNGKVKTDHVPPIRTYYDFIKESDVALAEKVGAAVKAFVPSDLLPLMGDVVETDLEKAVKVAVRYDVPRMMYEIRLYSTPEKARTPAMEELVDKMTSQMIFLFPTQPFEVNIIDSASQDEKVLFRGKLMDFVEPKKR